ncbi:electron transport complex protein RnfB [Thiolapillus brandeum]|uniref:Ion-translocating oxidoreductase complex subunit B n=1 Tax=Thiolapillus brandeum TaxID=1076588 RepID=A0A7U6GHR1_9GAMM|nr:electron transport complex protein RnfB [Thiolapillus brandeum]
MSHILVAIGFMSALGLMLSGILALANRKLWVYEDPRIDEVEELLPSTNCGACGTAGCRPFAEALIRGELKPAQCTVNSRDAAEDIAEYLGVDAGDVIKRVARLACAGGTHVARNKAHYDGLESCRAAAMVSGGPKGCAWGCIGLSDCAEVCDQKAIHMNPVGLPVVDPDKCTACNDCVEICPKGLFSLQPITHQLWVACNNQLHGDDAEADCEVACTACEKCAVDAPDGLIEIRNNLAVIDYHKNQLASPAAIERCPTGAIVWLQQEQPLKGRQARRIIRRKPLPLR